MLERAIYSPATSHCGDRARGHAPATQTTSLMCCFLESLFPELFPAKLPLTEASSSATGRSDLNHLDRYFIESPKNSPLGPSLPLQAVSERKIWGACETPNILIYFFPESPNIPEGLSLQLVLHASNCLAQGPDIGAAGGDARGGAELPTF